MDDHMDDLQEYKPWMEVSTFISWIATLFAVLAFIVMLIKWKLKKSPVEQARIYYMLTLWNCAILFIFFFSSFLFRGSHCSSTASSRRTVRQRLLLNLFLAI